MSIPTALPQADSLVLYKSRPARVLAIGEKIEILLETGQKKRVRPKDIQLLHPGPFTDFSQLQPPEGELEAAWELLAGTETDLPELAELIFGEYSPATAWAAWQQVADGLLFQGSPQAIRVVSKEQVEQERAKRQAKAAAEQDWQAFLRRMAAGKAAPEDGERLKEVERLALGQTERSRILQALGHQETPENAHRALIQVGYWAPQHNPYPGRAGLPDRAPDLPVGDLPEEPRLDLTQLPAYAIDDAGNEDPDDALSFDGERLWIHVADVAALVPPDSDLDREARARGCNQYRPEATVNMLPPAITHRLGLGLQEISPALSFACTYDAQGALVQVDVHRTWVRVQRLSYESAEACLQESPFREIADYIAPFRQRRFVQGAARIQLPEVSVRVRGDEIQIRPLPILQSRALVMDAMLMAGEAAARWCQERQMPIPYVTQAPPEQPAQPQDLAGMYAYRRQLKPSRVSLAAGPHAGLGLSLYTRATSPLRRYSDLLVHQQIRAQLRGEPLLSEEQISARLGEAEEAAAAVRRVERLSNQHWKLLFLKAHPNWQGEGVVVDQEDQKTVVLIPELALETRLRLRSVPDRNRRLQLRLRGVDVPDLLCWFQAQSSG